MPEDFAPCIGPAADGRFTSGAAGAIAHVSANHPLTAGQVRRFRDC